MRKTGGKKGGRSLAASKKTNIKRNKLVKAGKMKPAGSKPRFVEGGHLKVRAEERKARKKAEGSMSKMEAEQKRLDEEEQQKRRNQRDNEALDEMVEMMDPEDVAFLKAQAARSQAASQKKKGRKGGSDDGDDDEEEDLERNALEKRAKAEDFQRESGEERKTMLPVRTKQGWVQRSIAVNGDAANGHDGEGEDEGEDVEEEEASDDEEEEEDLDLKDQQFSVIELMAKRRQFITEKKLEIGSMASNFLELPEERLNVLEKLVKMVSGGGEVGGKKGELDAAKHTVTKLACLTVCEILKDIIPNYKILETKEQDKDQKLKKETMRLQKYEQGILTCTKNYLVKLEKTVQNPGGNLSVKDTALRCMCQLLTSHPQFNYAQNIVAFVVPYLSSGLAQLRSIALESLQALFRADKRGEISHVVIKKINHFLKTKKRDRVKPEMLEVLLALKLHSLNEAQMETQRKEEEARALKKKKKQEAQPMSKKEKKRQKAKAKLEKELLEAKGEESKQVRLRFAADVTNLLFAIYFRILKSLTDPAESEKFTGKAFRMVLRPLFSGLAKFGHLMSIEYFQDLLRCIAKLLSDATASGEDDDSSSRKLGKVEVLLCIHTVFAILSGQGDQLTIDPVTFYNRIAVIALDLNANDEVGGEAGSSGNSPHQVMYQVLKSAFILRRKKVTRNQLIDIWKRVTISVLNSTPDGALHLLKFLNESANTNPSLWANMLSVDEESEVGGGGGGAACVAAGRNLSHAGAAGGGSHNEMEGKHLTQHILNGNSLLWEISSLCQHPDDNVASQAEALLKAGSATTGVTSSRKRPLPLSKPANIEHIVDEEDDDYEELPSSREAIACLTEIIESYNILSQNLPTTTLHKAAKRKRK